MIYTHYAETQSKFLKAAIKNIDIEHSYQIRHLKKKSTNTIKIKTTQIYKQIKNDVLKSQINIIIVIAGHIKFKIALSKYT